MNVSKNSLQNNTFELKYVFFYFLSFPTINLKN